MAEKYILVIDEGTTGTRALIIDRNSDIKGLAYTEFTQYHPAPDRAEHDAEEIWEATVAMVKKALAEAGLKPSDIATTAITNQRCTTVLWDRKTAKPVNRAIVWQDTRTQALAESLKPQWADKCVQNTGNVLNAINSCLYLNWIMENVPGVRARAEAGDLAYGTIDSWLMYKLTGGKVHAIAASNASCTQTYDLHKDQWYAEWPAFLGVPMAIYPTICDDASHLGDIDPSIFGATIPITSAVGDQQAALFGQGCLEAGTVKCTHGTGTFLDMNVGHKPTVSARGLNGLVAWRMNGEATYMLEGYFPTTGSAVQWLRDGAEVIETSAETEELAASLPDNASIYFVPALAGLGAPSWDMTARGLIIGITRGTTRAHLARATLEGIVYSTKDFLETMRQDSGVDIKSIKVDGGAARNNWLMQFQADMLDAEVVRPINPEATSLGAAYMAGLVAGYWKSPAEALASQKAERVFTPQMSAAQRDKLYGEWTKAVQRSMAWVK